MREPGPARWHGGDGASNEPSGADPMSRLLAPALTLFAPTLLNACPESAAGPPDRTLEHPTKLLAVPAGKTWKLVWHDEFDGDGARLAEVGDPPRGSSPRRALVAQVDPARRQGAPAHRDAQGGQGLPLRLRADPRQVRACLRLLRGPLPDADAARVLVGLLDVHAGGRPGGRRRPRRHRDRHLREAVARRPDRAQPALGRLRKGAPPGRQEGEGARDHGGLPHFGLCGRPTSTSSTSTARRPGGPAPGASARCPSTSS